MYDDSSGIFHKVYMGRFSQYVNFASFVSVPPKNLTALAIFDELDWAINQFMPAFQ
jgi:hypothetical protein